MPLLFALSSTKAQQAADLQKQIPQAPHDSVRIRLYLQLADFYYKKSITDSSIFFVQKGISLSQKAKLPIHQSELYRLLGSNYRKKNNYNTAIDLLIKSRAIAARLHQNAQIEKAGISLALTYASKGDYKNLIREIAKNLDFAERTRSNFKLYENYLLLSDLNLRFGNDSLYHYYLRKSWQVEVETARRANKPYRVELKAVMLTDSIFSTIKKGQYQPATQILKSFQTIERAFSDNTKDSYIAMIEDITMAYLAYGFNQDALALLEYMLKYINREKVDKADYLQLTIYPLMTKIYLKQDKLQRAIFWHNKSKMLLNSHVLLTDVSSISSKINILRNEAAILEKRGLYKEALPYLHTLETLEQNLNQKRKDIELMQVIAVTELEVNKQKVASLNDQIKIQNLTMENDRKQKMFLFIFILLLLLLSALIFFFLRQSSLKNKLLIEQKEKIEAQTKQLEEAN